MKYFLSVVSISFLLAPIAVMAASTDVTASESSVITVGGINLTVSDAANFDSITVNGSDFTIDLSKGASLTVTSSDRRKFTVSPSTYQQSFACGSSNSTLQVGNNLWDSTVTVTVTPSSDTCSVEGGGGGGSGGSSGGGGGGGGNLPTPAYVVIPGTVVKTTETARATQEVSTPVSSVPTIVSEGSVSFSRSLKVKMSGSDVKLLQQILNSDPDTKIADSGIGSRGNETNYFGAQTQSAVKKFQKKYKVAKEGDVGYGEVGPKTRAKLIEISSTVSTPAQAQVSEVATTPAPVSAVEVPATSVAAVSAVFNIAMGKGMTNSDVKRLQQILNSDPDTKIADSGVGSLGNETNYFGAQTEKAVKKFQEKYGLAKQGDPGYGFVGPKTRSKLGEIAGSAKTNSESSSTDASQSQAQSQSLSGSVVSSQPSVSSSQTDVLQSQIQDLMKQIETLQVQIKAAQQ